MKIIGVVYSFVMTLIVLPFVKKMLIEYKVTGKNYKGDIIPVGMGISIVPIILLNALLLRFLLEENEFYSFLVLSLGMLTMAFLGLIDDLIGNRNTLGFKGHITALFKGNLTTGGLKAVIGGLISLLLGSLFAKNIIDILTNGLLIALFTNFINLLDLRPGRALKGFLFSALLFFFIGITLEVRSIFFPIIAYVIAYFPQDVRARSMMGDVGSNPLGICLGIIAAMSFSNIIKYIILLFLIIIHGIAEKYSLSQIIEKNPILNFVDKIGRI